MHRRLGLALGLMLAAAPLGYGAAVAASARPQAALGYTAPRNNFGQSDFSGAWSNATLTTESRPAALGAKAVYTEAEVAKLEHDAVVEARLGGKDVDPNAPAPKVGGEDPVGVRPEFAAAAGGTGGYDRGWLDPGMTVMRVRGQPRTSILTTANGQPPPRKGGGSGGGGPPRGGGLGSFDSYENRSLGERCILSFGRNAGPPMLSNGFYNNNYAFAQSADTVLIEVELVHDTRVIRLNAAHRSDGVRPWFGDSIGRWEGDTLVVETTNIPEAQAYRGSWKNLKVTERFTRVAKDRLLYQFTVDDPTIWDGAWGGEYEFAPLNGRLYEYACHEGNYALPGILAGARADEAKGAGR